MAIAAAVAEFEQSKGLGDGEVKAPSTSASAGGGVVGGGGTSQGGRDAPRKSILPMISRIVTPSGTKVSDPPVLKR